jgi:hypothetical protein
MCGGEMDWIGDGWPEAGVQVDCPVIFETLIEA